MALQTRKLELDGEANYGELLGKTVQVVYADTNEVHIIERSSSGQLVKSYRIQATLENGHLLGKLDVHEVKNA